MNTIKSLVVATVIASSFITTGVASNIIEDTDVVKRIVVKMGHENTDPIILDGWSGGEITHRWTVAEYSGLSIPVQDGDKRLSKALFKMAAFANDAHPQSLEITADYNVESVYKGTYTNMNPFQISLNFPADYAQESVMYMFCMPNLCKPEVIDPSNKDPRTLAFAFTDIELEYTKK